MNAALSVARRLPVGAEVVDGGTHFRVWAPDRHSVAVLPAVAERATRQKPALLEPEGDGHWSGLVGGLAAGSRYWLVVDEGRPTPDPVSRFQPEGPHGPSEVVDPAAFSWTDHAWGGPDPTRPALYELHVGTFTPEGTYAAAATHLEELADVGIGVIELMPLAEFPGDFGWGYDGVDLFAPEHAYGRPDDLRRFVDDAHRVGLAVILDVVYNHFGPDGCYLPTFSDEYLSRVHVSDWGASPNFDGQGSDGMREFVIANARHWIAEYHMDGLRIDATQQIFDASPDHIVAALTREVRAAADGRRTLVIAENEPQETRYVRDPSDGGFGLDALWNDDVHHSAMVALTGRAEAYYSDYRGRPQEFVSAARHGYLFQGQRSTWQGHRRGTPGLDLRSDRFVTYLQNHDQVANSARGDRATALASPGRLRAMTAYLLLGPARPLLFMGEEWGASSPFVYFADHHEALAADVDAGRRGFLSQFPSIAVPDVLAGIPPSGDRATFQMCVLDHGERARPGHAEWLALHRELLSLRRKMDSAPGGPPDVEGAVLNDAAFCIRFFPPGERRGWSGAERLLIVNLGPAVTFAPAPEPLLAPPIGSRWDLALATEDPRFGGVGSPAPESDEGWRLPAEAAVLLAPVPRGSP